MPYIKQTVILKQYSAGFSSDGKELSGIVRIESEDGIATLKLSLINLCALSGGDYYLAVTDTVADLHVFPLGSNPMSGTFVFENVPDLSSGFSAAFVFCNGDNKFIGYGKTAEFPHYTEEVKRIVDGALNKPKPDAEPEVKSETEKEVAYCDETVANENYYLNEDVDAENLSIKSTPEEYSDLSVEEPAINEAAATDFYDTARDELFNLFEEYPEETAVMKALPDSKFVKINYSGDKFYVTGIIYGGKKPKYICYGVPAKYSVTPPEALKGYCSFIPLSVFDTRGDGYWMMFQDAVSGKCIKFDGETDD